MTIARTPIALPSFSSQALSTQPPSHRRSDSELRDTSTRIGEIVAGPILISAFDLHNRHLPEAPAGKAVFNAPLTFIDSGGYENIRVSKAKAITVHQHRAVLDQWPENVQTVVVNFDVRSNDVGQQIEAAIGLCEGRTMGRELLLKPGPKIDLPGIISQLSCYGTSLSNLDAVGITEKEAGGSLRDRLRTTRALRRQLDTLGLQDMPIHIFGGLDPLRTPLYFLAGADIFDGLSWLRYGYYQGQAVYLEAFASAEYPQSAIGDAEWSIRHRNFIEVTKMQTSMLRYLATDQATDLHPAGERLLKVLAEAGED